MLANDADAEEGELIAILVDDPTHGAVSFEEDGSFSYASDVAFMGTDWFTYRSTDGLAQSELATVTIEVTNSSPTATDDSYVVSHDRPLSVDGSGVLFNDVDEDQDMLRATLLTGPEHGTLVLHPGGSFVYTPDSELPGFTGTLRVRELIASAHRAERGR